MAFEIHDESVNPMSVEEFERVNAMFFNALGDVFHRELARVQPESVSVGDVQSSLDLHLVGSDVPLVFGDSLDGVGKGFESLTVVPKFRCLPGFLGGFDRILLHGVVSFVLGILIGVVFEPRNRGKVV